MRFIIKKGIFPFLLLGFLLTASAEEQVSPDFDNLKTIHGREYRDIFILNADDNGLLFRHQAGIAKLAFTELSYSLRELFEPSPDQQVEADVPDSEASEQPQTLNIQIVQRPVYQVAPVSQLPVWSPCASNYGYATPWNYNPNSLHNAIYRPHLMRPRTWPSHWSRWHHGHALVNPYHRAAVTQDFLYTTGLVPRPPGVNITRLR